MGYQRTLSDQGLFLLPLSLKRRKEETAPEAHSNKEVSPKGTATGRIGRRAFYSFKGGESEMGRLKFMDYDAADWKLDVVADIVTKVKAWCDEKGLKDVVLCTVENCVWSDPKNQRYDVGIQYISDEGVLTRQRLLILKGEVIDGETFHKRYHEFY
jgi:hypothetical protein